jgi:hypothetical protein
MRLVVRVRGQLTPIVGYGPGEAGVPMAIVILDGGLHAVGLSEIELLHFPHKLRKRLKKALRKQSTETQNA